MPLIKGKSLGAFKHNVEVEQEAGKPKDQALAIAYATQRAAKKKMSIGGEVPSKPISEAPSSSSSVAEAIRNRMKEAAAPKGMDEEDLIDLEDDSFDLDSDILDEPAPEASRELNMVSRIRERLKARRGF